MYPVILVSIIAGCRNRQPEATMEDLPRVRVAEITRVSMSIPVHATGILGASEEIKLSFKTGGLISAIHVREGQKVRKGSLLASLNLSEVNAAVNQAKNGYEKALRDFKRAENLYRDSVATLEMRQNAATALDVAKSTLEIANFNLEHSTITAPSDGIILRQLAKTNELVASGYPVFLFGTSGKYWKVRSGISDKDIVKINSGDSASVTFDAWPSVKFSGVVDETGEMANPATGTYETEISIQSSKYRLASGFVAGVDIYPAQKKSFTMIPISALVAADGMNGYVFIVGDSSTVRKIRVGIENIPGDRTAVSGIPQGATEIVTEGSAYLRDGMKVNVIK